MRKKILLVRLNFPFVGLDFSLVRLDFSFVGLDFSLVRLGFSLVTDEQMSRCVEL
jgi:hypothetical protein